MFLMATTKKESPEWRAMVQASLALIVLLPLDFVLMMFNIMSGLRYISTTPPPWHEPLTRAVHMLLLYVFPTLLFVGAGAFIRKRVGRNGILNGVKFGMLWTCILFVAILVQYVVLYLNKIYKPDGNFLRQWSQSLLIVLIGGIGMIALSALGGLIGDLRYSKDKR